MAKIEKKKIEQQMYMIYIVKKQKIRSMLRDIAWQ